MKRYKPLLIEDINLPDNKWVDIPLSKLDHTQLDRIWNIYEHSYKEIGLSVNSLRELISKYKISWVIDVDKDNDPDAFIIYKETHHGNKITLMGSDGTSEAKRSAISQMLSLLKKHGFYTEASHKVAEILEKNHIHEVDDPKIISSILEADIQWLGHNNQYNRKISGVGVVTKKMFGNPK